MSASKCPVCGWEVKEDGREVKLGARSVAVCCADCEKVVKENPERYGAGR